MWIKLIYLGAVLILVVALSGCVDDLEEYTIKESKSEGTFYSVEDCDEACLAAGHEGSTLSWPTYMNMPHVNIGPAIINNSKYCEKEGDCYCYCYNYTNVSCPTCGKKPQSTEEPSCTAETGETVTLSEAREIAKNSECVENATLTGDAFCNSGTGTWWLNLDILKRGCNPACVVYVETKNATINYRCKGLVE